MVNASTFVKFVLSLEYVIRLVCFCLNNGLEVVSQLLKKEKCYLVKVHISENSRCQYASILCGQLVNDVFSLFLKTFCCFVLQLLSEIAVQSSFIVFYIA